jgi:hypothetical protein
MKCAICARRHHSGRLAAESAARLHTPQIDRRWARVASHAYRFFCPHITKLELSRAYIFTLAPDLSHPYIKSHPIYSKQGKAGTFHSKQTELTNPKKPIFYQVNKHARLPKQCRVVKCHHKVCWIRQCDSFHL